MVTESRKDEIKQDVEDAIRGSAIRMVHFGREYTGEEKDFAVGYGSNFDLSVESDHISVPAGMNKGRAYGR